MLVTAHISAKWNDLNITTTITTRPTTTTMPTDTTTPYNKERGGRRKSRKLSPHVSGINIKIWLLKDNGVATLTFWGHVTSSVMQPFDSQWSTSYGWSIVTMPLSGTVMEIWRLKVHVHKHHHTEQGTYRTTDRMTNLLMFTKFAWRRSQNMQSIPTTIMPVEAVHT